MIEDFDYKTDVSIDESALDIEWLQQAELMMKYTQLEAQAERDYDQAKKQLDIIEAELYKEICNNPDEHDLPKTTEGAIQGAILKTDKYQEAQEKVTEAKYEYNMAKNAVRAMYGKKDALENLVRLHGQQYFAGPKAPRNLTKELMGKQKSKRNNAKIKMKNPKRKRKK